MDRVPQCVNTSKCHHSSSVLHADDVLCVNAPQQPPVRSGLMIDDSCRWRRRVISQTVSSDPTHPTEPTDPLNCCVIDRTQLWNSPTPQCCPLQEVTCQRDPPNKRLELKRRRGSFWTWFLWCYRRDLQLQHSCFTVSIGTWAQVRSHDHM